MNHYNRPVYYPVAARPLRFRARPANKMYLSGLLYNAPLTNFGAFS